MCNHPAQGATLGIDGSTNEIPEAKGLINLFCAPEVRPVYRCASVTKYIPEAMDLINECTYTEGMGEWQIG